MAVRRAPDPAHSASVSKPLKLMRQEVRSIIALEDSLARHCLNSSGAVASVLLLSLVSLYFLPEVVLPSRDES